MSIGATQIIKSSTYIADEAIAQYAAVVQATLQGHCKYPAAAADVCVGIAQNSATASGDTIEVCEHGDSYVLAYALGTIGQPLAIADTSGRVSRPTAFVSGDGYVGYYKEAPTAQDDQVLAAINVFELVR